jgi:hypothetical protein
MTTSGTSISSTAALQFSANAKGITLPTGYGLLQFDPDEFQYYENLFRALDVHSRGEVATDSRAFRLLVRRLDGSGTAPDSGDRGGNGVSSANTGISGIDGISGRSGDSGSEMVERALWAIDSARSSWSPTTSPRLLDNDLIGNNDDRDRDRDHDNLLNSRNLSNSKKNKRNSHNSHNGSTSGGNGGIAADEGLASAASSGRRRVLNLEHWLMLCKLLAYCLFVGREPSDKLFEQLHRLDNYHVNNNNNNNNNNGHSHDGSNNSSHNNQQLTPLQLEEVGYLDFHLDKLVPLSSATSSPSAETTTTATTTTTTAMALPAVGPVGHRQQQQRQRQRQRVDVTRWQLYDEQFQSQHVKFTIVSRLSRDDYKPLDNEHNVDNNEEEEASGDGTGSARDSFTVERRYSEFAMLHALLSKQYRHVLLPPLPAKQPWFQYLPLQDGAMQLQLQQRALELQLFLDYATSHPVLQHSLEVCLFLQTSTIGLRHLLDVFQRVHEGLLLRRHHRHASSSSDGSTALVAERTAGDSFLPNTHNSNSGNSGNISGGGSQLQSLTKLIASSAQLVAEHAPAMDSLSSWWSSVKKNISKLTASAAPVFAVSARDALRIDDTRQFLVKVVAVGAGCEAVHGLLAAQAVECHKLAQALKGVSSSL